MSDEQRSMGPFGTATRRDGSHFAHYGVSPHSSIYNTLRSSFLVLKKMGSRRSDLVSVNRPLSTQQALQFRYDTEQITGQADVGNFKNGRFRVLVDRNDGARVLDAGDVLDSARNSECQVQIG